MRVESNKKTRSAQVGTMDLGQDLRRLSPKVTGGLLRIREAAYADGEIPAKHKVLAALAISVAIKCEPCIEMYAGKAADLGATIQELAEFLDVAMAMGGCPGEAWAQKALQSFQEAVSGTDRGRSDGASCCE